MTRTLPPDELTPDEPAAKPRRPAGGLPPRRAGDHRLSRRAHRRLVPGQARRRPEERQLPVPAGLGRLDQGAQRVGQVQQHPVDTRLHRLPAHVGAHRRRQGEDRGRRCRVPLARGRGGRPGRPAAVHRYRRLDLGAAHRRGQRQGARRPDTGGQREAGSSTPPARTHRQALRCTARAPGGLLVAFIDAFSGLDGALLLSAGLVVIVILLIVYRSPVCGSSRCSARCSHSARRRW